MRNISRRADSSCPRAPQEKMSLCVLIATLLSLPLAQAQDAVVLSEREEVQMVCAGKEFRLPVYSTSRIVTFNPDSGASRRVLLERTTVKDPRFEWTRDKMLVLREVTHADQGLYAIKMSSGFTYETVHLTVSECIKSYYRHYGENFEHHIPENGSLLEFAPRGTPLEAMPVVLWNLSDAETSNVGRGRLQRGGKVWVAEKVTQADQGNYTLKNHQGKVMSRSTLTVRGRSFNVTRFTKESLNLPLFLPVSHTHLIFTPKRSPDETSLGPFDPKPPRGSVQLMREGQITAHDMRYRGLVSLGRNGTVNEVVIARLTSRHDGVYEIKDRDGSLVSSTLLQVIERGGRWRGILKSITVPSGMFVSLAGFILFMKRYPHCSLSQIIAGLRTNRTPQAHHQSANIQDYSQPSPQSSGFYAQTQQPGTPRKWTPRPSPAHTGYTPVTGGTPRAQNQAAQRSAATSSPSCNTQTAGTSNEEDRAILFPVPWASDCLHSSEECVQFQIKKDGEKERWSKSKEFFTTLPLDTDTSECSSVYTSDKLNFL